MHPTPPDAPAAPAAPPPRRSTRATAKSVIVADAVAGAFVRLGGLMTIVAVVGILVFLVATVLPLFQPAELRPTPVAGRVPAEGSVHAAGVDEYALLAWAVGDAPQAVFFRPDTGAVVARMALPGIEGGRVVAAFSNARTGDLAVAAEDGRVCFGSVSFASDFVLGPAADALRRGDGKMAPDEVRVVDGAVVQRRTGGNLRRVRPFVAARGACRLPAGSPAPVAVSYAAVDDAGAAAVIDAGGGVHLIRQRPGSGEDASASFEVAPLAAEGPTTPADPVAALVDEEAHTLWVVGRSGGLLRADLRQEPAVRREGRWLASQEHEEVVAAGLVIGGRSLVVAGASGGVSVWSPVPLPAERVGKDGDPGDGRVTVRLHAFPRFESPVTRLQSSATKRLLYLGHADGSVSLAYTTNQRVLGRVEAFHGPASFLAPVRQDDRLIVGGPGGVFKAFDVECPHPESSLRALFLPIHYEGYPKADLVYQSSAASDEAEPKLSLTPLLYGTVKATFYAMLFALPLALLGALYTSQFMHPRVRAVVKPTVEVMASLPSVVLGFIGGLVLAPAVEKVVPGVFASVVALVLVGALAGFAWYLIPSHRRNRVGPTQRLLVGLVLAAATVGVALASSGAVERSLFSGSFRAWLRCEPGTGDGLPLLRVGLFALGSAVGVLALPRWVRVPAPPGAAGRLLAGAARAVLYALLPGVVLALAAPVVQDVLFGGDFRWWLVGQDLRGKPPGTVYDQRNSLVVGLAMGFAVIPIIYTIAEDALSAIPESLKSAALGCGASPWQTAVRVVVPAAAPGIFSAAMIGLGRAVGETMIVLMAAGGTAIMDWSIFNGFRTLSANIATELPEAPQGSTLYRVLFLAGLLLFALTFVLNTVAEAVRLRFRRKFKQL